MKAILSLSLSSVIPANLDDTIELRFSTTKIDKNIFRRLLVGNIKDIDPNLKDIQGIVGRKERPISPFELDEGTRHENGLRRVEFKSIGMIVKKTKDFSPA